MCDLDALTFGGEQNGMVTHNIPCPNGFETDLLD
jgi:hypothetical protein